MSEWSREKPASRRVSEAMCALQEEWTPHRRVPDQEVERRASPRGRRGGFSPRGLKKRHFNSRSKHVRKLVIKSVPDKRLNQVEARPVGLVVESESEDEEEAKPRAKRKPLLSELCSLNRRGSEYSESCSYIRGKVSNKDVFALILVDTGNTTQNDIIRRSSSNSQVCH